MDQDPLNAVIVEREMLTESLGIFRIAYEGGDAPDFEPGQFANLGLPKLLDATADDTQAPPSQRRRKRVPMTRRAYSIASPPSEKRWLEFYVVAVDEGALTPRLFDLNVGDRLFMETKIKGHFTLKDVPTDKTVVGVATGTGLAPFLSMYHQYKGQGRWKKFVLLHGVRYEDNLGYRDELEQIAKQDDRFIYIPTVTRPDEKGTWKGVSGRVTEVFHAGRYEKLVGEPLVADDTHVMLCGNPAMIDQLEIELVERYGYVVKTPRQKDGNLHFERYW